jgi:hypothetical protein
MIFVHCETTGELAAEPLLQANPHRFVLFPIQHNNIWRMYKKAKASIWTAEEIDLAADATDWDRLSTTEQHFILHVLAFFAASDGIVNENLRSNFANEVTSLEPDASMASRLPSKTFTARGTRSSSTRMSRTPRPTKKMHLLRAMKIKTVPFVQQKAQWALRWCDSTAAS